MAVPDGVAAGAGFLDRLKPDQVPARQCRGDGASGTGLALPAELGPQRARRCGLVHPRHAGGHAKDTGHCPLDMRAQRRGRTVHEQHALVLTPIPPCGRRDSSSPTTSAAAGHASTGDLPRLIVHYGPPPHQHRGHCSRAGRSRLSTISPMPWHGPRGRRLYYEDSGRGGTPGVLMPGWGGSITELSQLRAELAAGFRVLAIDLPGSGRSEPRPRHYPAGYYQDDARTLLGLLDEPQDRVRAPGRLQRRRGGGAVTGRAQARSCAVGRDPRGGRAAGRAAGIAFEAIAAVMDSPDGDLVPLAAYLAQAYGVAGARIMTRTWAQAMAARSLPGAVTSAARAPRPPSPARSCS